MKKRFLLFDLAGGRLMGDTEHFLPDGAEHEIEAARALDDLLDIYPIAYHLRGYAELSIDQAFLPGYICAIVAHGLPIKRNVNVYDNARYLNAMDAQDAGVVLQQFTILEPEE